MSAPLKKPRQARVETNRSHQGASSLVKAGGSDENAHLWVVSYADLLMVLLCFFVLFFSTDKKRVDTVIQRILLTTSQHVSPGYTGGTSKKSSTGSADSALEASGLSSNLKSEIQSFKLKTSLNNDNLILDLPDDAYPRGGTHLSDTAANLLLKILKQLKPYANEIDLVFVGHTDPSPVSRTKSRRIADNLDLSSERAKNAMLIAAGLGFPDNQLRIEGDASSRRQSRTLSLRVIDRRGKQ